VACLFIPFFGIGSLLGLQVFLISASFWLVFNGVKLLKEDCRDMFYISAFRRVNIFLIIVLSALSLDRILGLIAS
jgi:hypothetical protein